MSSFDQAPQPVGPMVDDAISKWFGDLATTIKSGSDSVHKSSLDMAQQIAHRLKRVTGAMSGKCTLTSAADSLDMSLPKEHADLFDVLRRKHPTTYRLAVDAARRFAKSKTDEQLSVLEKDMPVLMSSMATYQR